MKIKAFKFIFLFLMICALTVANAQKKQNTILGKWIGTDARSESGGIEFLADGTAKVVIMGQQILVNEYKFDDSKDPIQISLTVRRNEKSLTLFGLMEFIDANTVKWEVFPMAPKQPVSFSENAADTSVVLRRQ